jgi:transposase
MLMLPASVRIYVASGPVDLRKGFDGLSGLVRNRFGCDPLDGALYVFFSRSRRSVKILWWDRDGFAIWHKRIERSRYRLPEAVPGSDKVRMEWPDLALLLEGIELRGARRRPRWQRAG